MVGKKYLFVVICPLLYKVGQFQVKVNGNFLFLLKVDGCIL